MRAIRAFYRANAKICKRIRQNLQHRTSTAFKPTTATEDIWATRLGHPSEQAISHLPDVNPSTAISNVTPNPFSRRITMACRHDRLGEEHWQGWYHNLGGKNQSSHWKKLHLFSRIDCDTWYIHRSAVLQGRGHPVIHNRPGGDFRGKKKYANNRKRDLKVGNMVDTFDDAIGKNVNICIEG